MFKAIASHKIKQNLLNKTSVHKRFSGLNLEESAFMHLEELIQLENKNTYEKILAFREIANMINQKHLPSNQGICYLEKSEPTLRFIFNTYINDLPDIYIEDHYKLPQKYHNSNEIVKSSYPYYDVSPAILHYLFKAKNIRTAIDRYLLQEYKEELELFKEYVESFVFYPDYSVVDSSGDFQIHVHHPDFYVSSPMDSISKDSLNLGEVVIHYIPKSDKYEIIFPINKGKLTGTWDFLEINESIGIKDKIYIHKPMLPPFVQKK